MFFLFGIMNSIRSLRISGERDWFLDPLHRLKLVLDGDATLFCIEYYSIFQVRLRTTHSSSFISAYQYVVSLIMVEQLTNMSTIRKKAH